MKDLWERFKRFCSGQERIERAQREFEQSMAWHEKNSQRLRAQYQLAMAFQKKEEQSRRERVQQQEEQAAKQARAELRDRFAMAALEGLLASGDVHTYNRDIRAVMAWQEADAMLKARDNA